MFGDLAITVFNRVTELSIVQLLLLLLLLLLVVVVVVVVISTFINKYTKHILQVLII